MPEKLPQTVAIETLDPFNQFLAFCQLPGPELLEIRRGPVFLRKDIGALIKYSTVNLPPILLTPKGPEAFY